MTVEEISGQIVPVRGADPNVKEKRKDHWNPVQEGCSQGMMMMMMRENWPDAQNQSLYPEN